MRIKDIMTKQITSCLANDTLETAARAMWDQDCGAIPVTSEDGSLVGMITDRDICMAAYTKGARLTELPVAEVMAKKTFACREQDDVNKALKLMRDKQIRRVPVIDKNNAPIGIVSIADLARASVEDDAELNGLNGEVVMQAIADVCEPRLPVPA